MRVRFDSRRGDVADRAYQEYANDRLTHGASYVVYAIGIAESGMWVYVADDDFVDGPRYYPLRLFDVECGAIPSSWALDVKKVDSDHPDMLAPLLWLRTPWFFNLLVDGDSGAVSVFGRLRAEIDEEDARIRRQNGDGADGE